MGFGEKKPTFKTWQNSDMENILHLIIVLAIIFQRSKCTHLVNQQYFVPSIVFSCNLVCMNFHVT